MSKADGATTVAPGSIKIISTEFNAKNLDPNQIYNFVGPRVAPNDDQVKSPSATGITISVGVGGSGAAAGSGEAVSVAKSGETATMGAYSMGVIAQSTGGGGGSAGATSSSSAKDRRFTLSLALGGSGGSAGDGRYVRVETDPGSTISTDGIHGTGILAQSVGGGGGVVAFSATANEFGVIKGFGVGVAIGGDGGASGHGGNFGVYHGSGAISTRGKHSPGIFAQSIGGGGGVALVASTEDTKRGALPKIADKIDLNLSFGGNGVTSGDAGQVAVVLLSVDGVATLAGTVAVNPITLAKTETTILTSRGGIKMADTPRSEATHIFIYETAVDGAALTLSTAADFTGASGGGGVNASLAGHLQDIWKDGSPGFGAAFADLANVTGSADYSETLDLLSGRGVSAVSAARFDASLKLVNRAFSCPTFIGSTAVLGERDCGWFRAEGTSFDKDGGSGSVGYDGTAGILMIGGQREVRPGWFVGGIAGYENSRLNSDGGATDVDGEAGLVLLALKRQTGPLLLAAAMDLGYGWYDSNRTINLGGTQAFAKASPNSFNAGLHFRAAYQVVREDWYLQPMVDFDLTYLRLDGYQESGAGAFDLDVEQSEGVIFAATPATKVGRRIDLVGGSVLNAFLSAGVSFMNGNDWDTKARFADAPSGTDGFSNTLDTPDVLDRITAGVEVFNAGAINIRAQYRADLASDHRSQSAELRLSMTF